MISLKKYLDSERANSKDGKAAPDASVAAPREIRTAPEPGSGLLSAYRAALAAMGSSGHRAIPSLGNMIETAMTRIGDGLARSATAESVVESRRAVETELGLWADQAQEKQKQSEQTIRELLLVVFEATESTGIRDEKFSHEISGLSDRLRAVAGLENLPLIRRSIMENTSALNSSVARMADEGRESIRRLTSEIAEYQTRLLASERRALVDPLTGICNRRGFEQQLEMRVQCGEPFSLLVADLNGFKATNDRYGHVVGDEILRQFSDELKAQFLPEDTVARWGGDEFVCIVAGLPKEGAARADRVRHWVLGEYKIALGTGDIMVAIDAAVGIVAWDGAETGLELFARADKEMYRVKQASRELV